MPPTDPRDAQTEALSRGWLEERQRILDAAMGAPSGEGRMSYCPKCAKLEEEIVGLKLSLKRIREQYDRVYTKAKLAEKYKRQRDDAQATVDAMRGGCRAS